MRIDGLFQGQIMNMTGAESILDRAKIGDIIRAQILEITSDELILKLFDGSTINTSTSSDMEELESKKGEFVDFRVKGKADNKVLLETVKNTAANKSDSNDELSRQVKAIGLATDTESMEIARELKSKNIPFNKENFDKVMDMISKFKDINPAKAVYLIANKLGAEERNVSALKQLVDEKVKITESLEKLISSIDKLNDKELFSNVSGKLMSENITESGINRKAIPDVPQTIKQQLNIQQSRPELQEEVNNLLNSVKSPETLSSDEKIIMEKIKTFLEYSKNSTGNISEKFSDFISKALLSQGKSLQDLGTGLTDLINNINSKLKGGLETKTAITIEKDIPKNNTNGGIVNNKDLKNEIRNIFDKIHVNINSDSLKDELNIKNLYKELYSRLEILKESIETAAVPNKAEIINHIDNMENNIRFMNQLNNYSTYVQIPLKMWDTNTTGELYILKKESKRRKIDPESATMFISLNTDNLGQVDTFIGVNKKNINVSMRVEDNDIIDFIKGHHKELYERLKEKGFKLVDLKFRIPEEEINMTNINEVAERELLPGKVTIDYRL